MDISKVKFQTTDTMRYDTPGDWQGEVITAWSGLEKPEYIEAVQFHEFIEAVILQAAGITPDMIDKIDIEGPLDIPIWILALYNKAHILALLCERELIEVHGLNWKEYDDFIESTRGKIPIFPK